MNPVVPPIYRDCRRLLVHTEQVVRRFSRYHKYTVGTDLRQQAFAVMRGVHTALYDRSNQARHVYALVWQVDAYKLTLQLAMDLGAFTCAKHTPRLNVGFSSFETAAQLAAAIGKQCGGWSKSVKAAPPPHTQNAGEAQAHGNGPKTGAASDGAPRPRPTSLSAHATTAYASAHAPSQAVAPLGLRVRVACPSMECRVVTHDRLANQVPVPISLAACYAAWQKARRGKKASANRTGKGSHSAVDRLQTFMRQRENMVCGSGWYLQLDIHNFFNTIHRPTLYAMLCKRLDQARRTGALLDKHALALRSLCHKLLARKTNECVRDPVAANLVPPHKRLRNAAPQCGLPVGNLTSLFERLPWLQAFFSLSPQAGLELRNPAKWQVQRHRAVRKIFNSPHGVFQ